MTIHCRVSWGINRMRRILPLLLALLCLLTACGKKEGTFVQDEDGLGCTNTDTGIHYKALDFCFRPAKTGRTVGTYVSDQVEYTRTYYEIPGKDTALFLADDEGGVWYAGDAPLTPSSMTAEKILVCENGDVSLALLSFTKEANGATVSALLNGWFSGTATELPEGIPSLVREIRILYTELENIHYCVNFCVMEDNGYLYDIGSGRAVALTPELTATLCGET